MALDSTWYVTSFYRFFPLEPERLPKAQAELASWMDERGIVGLVILAEEGINATVSGPAAAIEEFKAHIATWAGCKDIRFKDSVSQKRPFKRRSVDIREEIVALKRPDLVPSSTEDDHLTPSEWHEWLSSDREKILIDTRNVYETMAGKFEGAIDPGLHHFSDWSSYLDGAELRRELPVLLYCTGGIRCEKAIIEMRRHGFENVYQLRDGILGYLAEYPDGHYQGECFVFDDRVTVGPSLEPTGNFGICPGCGLTSDLKRDCPICGETCFICGPCEEKMAGACSKRCRDARLQQARKSRKQAQTLPS